MHKHRLSGLIFLVLFTACASTKDVNRYAISSEESLEKFNEVNYSFADYCRNDCELQQLRSAKIDPAFKCDCETEAAKADDAIQHIHLTVLNYLEALDALSNNGSFTADVSDLGAAIQANGLLHITTAQMAVFTKAGNFLANAATTYYRKRKLSQYLGEADTIFQQLMTTYSFLIGDRLQKQLDIAHEMLDANNQQMLMNSNSSPALQQFIIKQSLDEKVAYAMHTGLISHYVKLLEKVKAGHHQLYLQRNKLNTAETRSLVQEYLKSLRAIMIAAKQLKHST